MSLQNGQMLAHYRLVEKLGEGGMGFVWKAIDTTLDRPVALKFLPAAVASDPDRVARFEREAKVLATLQHPNIASVFSVHRSAEAEFLVMELVAGEDLSQRLKRGPLPVEDALAIARQIAQALESAHAAGIVHRDLKPANVKVTPGGQAKVLDFGLAKALGAGADSAPSAALSLSPTVTAGTMTGMIMGTAPYMSPEQAKGRPVDRRTDLWSFGVVLWEMLTGQRLFTGESASEILAEVLKTEPDFAALPEGVPPAIRRLLRRCLARDPKARLHDAADARLEIEEAGHEELAAPAPRPAIPSWRRTLPWLVAAIAVAAVAFLLLGTPQGPVPAEVIRFSVRPPATVLPDDEHTLVDLSSNGREVVFTGVGEDGRFAYRRSLGRTEPERIAGTEGAEGVFLSPDGRWVGFFVGSSMRKVPIEGGKPVVLGEFTANRGASWGEDGNIVVTPTYNTGLVRIPDTGGPSEALTEPDSRQGERSHRWPQVVPGGRWVLFTVGRVESPGSYDAAAVDAIDLRTGSRHRVLEGARMARFVAPHFLLFQRHTSLLYARMDPERMELLGAPVSLLEGVGGEASSGVGYWAVSQNGVLAYALQTAIASDRLLVLANASSPETTLSIPPGSYFQPRVSPDGARIAFSAGTGAAADDDVWIFDLAAARLDRLTFGGGNGIPCWAPDGAHIAYARGGTGQTGIYWKRVDGAGAPEVLSLTSGGEVLVPESFHPNGEELLASHAAGNVDLMRIRIGSGEPPEVILGKSYAEYGAAYSPDGRYIAYTSQESGVDEVIVRGADGVGQWQVSQGGGTHPLWARDGERIYFSRDQALLVARVQTEPTFRADPPEELFSGPYELSANMIRNFDLLPDGRFVLLNRALGGGASGEISIVVGWPQLVEADRAPRLAFDGRNP